MCVPLWMPLVNLPTLARGAGADAADEFEVELGVTGPGRGGVGERVGDVEEGHGRECERGLGGL
jgi:hypothetical protein